MRKRTVSHTELSSLKCHPTKARHHLVLPHINSCGGGEETSPRVEGRENTKLTGKDGVKPKKKRPKLSCCAFQLVLRKGRALLHPRVMRKEKTAIDDSSAPSMQHPFHDVLSDFGGWTGILIAWWGGVGWEGGHREIKQAAVAGHFISTNLTPHRPKVAQHKQKTQRETHPHTTKSQTEK